MNRPLGLGSVALGAALLATCYASYAFVADGDPPPKSPARRAVEPATPDLPASIVAAMQDGKYDEADKALDALSKLPKTPAADRDYYAVIRGAALRLGNRLDPAREVLTAALKDAPNGRWAPKLRSELASVEIAARKFAAAETIARAEAESLLGDDRKDRLAAVYKGFGDRLLRPDLPTIPADPEGAYALLVQARGLAKGASIRASLLLAMAKASQQANNPGRAITDYQAYLNEYPKGADRAAARFGLAESQLAAGQALPARLTWTDLARDLEKVDTREAADFRARSLYGIARTHGIPAPGDDAQLNLGVAALKRLVASYPTHQLAVRASYDIAASYLARGKSEEALKSLTAFVKADDPRGDDEAARRERAELVMAAQFQVGQILQGQGKFDEAIAAFKGYLSKFPNGPQSADAQRAVVDSQLLIASDLQRREKYADARAAFVAFAAQNPLDARVPQVLFEVGQTYFAEKKLDEAIAAWETLAGKFPGTEPAGHGQFSAAWILEHEKGDLIGATERYRKVAVDPWRTQALQRVALMESKALSVVTERAFRSGETPTLKIATRNLPRLTFTAYKIDPETYFRKKRTLSGVEALDIGLVAPDAEWTAEVPGYAKYRPIDTTYELKKLEIPGVWVVKVTDEKALQATTLVLGTDLDAIVKTSREQLLVYVQDMKTGKGRADARVLVSDDTGVILDAKTGRDGVLLREWDKPLAAGQAAPAQEAAAPIPPPAVQPAAPPQPCGPEPQAPAAEAPPARPHLPQGRLRYLVLDGDNAAGSGLDVPNKVAQGLTPRAYLYTDRPAYRPGDVVEMRGVVREVVDGQYANVPGATYKLEAYDSRGRRFLDRSVKLSDYGTFHESIALDEGAPVGAYRVRVFRPGKGEFAGAFEVQAYQLEKIDLAFDLAKTVYFRGETIKGTLIAKYQYGTPLAQRQIALALPDGRTLEGKTDDEGKYKFELETTGFAEEQALTLAARLPQDNVAINAMVMLAVRGYRIDLSTTRDVFLDGESFALGTTTVDAQGNPTGQTVSVAVLKKVNRNGQVVEKEVSREDVKTDAKTGKGSIRLKVEDEDSGEFVIRASGTDQFGNPIFTEKAIIVSGKKDETKLRILADRTTFRVGEQAEVRLINRGAAGTILLTWEADRILSYKLVPVKEGENPLAWSVDGPQFPNFTLAAARMAPPALHEARLDVRVERDLKVAVSPKTPQVGPGGEVEVEITATDQNGKPASAEVSLALVDRSLLRLYADRLPSIDGYFYNQSRTSAFATESTATFGYTPPTVPVPEAVVEVAAQEAAMLADMSKLDQARKEAGDVALALSAPATDAPAGTPTPAGPEAADRAPMPGGASRAGGKAGQAGPGGGGGSGANGGRFKDANRPMDAAKVEAAEALAERGSESPEEGKAGDTKAMAKRKGNLAFGRRDRGLAGRPGAAGDQAEAPRERFVETAYWNPSVVTGKDGRATVKFKAPGALSEYRFTARGVTGADTLVGQGTADLAVRKDFFVDLKAPAALTRGDKPRFSAEVHHKGVPPGAIDLRLTIYAGGREVVQPKKVEFKADGVSEVLFDPFDVPDGDEVKLTLAATSGDSKDEMTVAVPTRPWGVQAFASSSGSATDDETVFVELPQGREYAEPEMLVVISPTLRRMIVELALGHDAYPLDRRMAGCFPIPPNTTADRAGDLLAASWALTYLQSTKANQAPEAVRLTDRIRGLVSELITLQNDDGGWPWVAGTSNQPRPSERFTSARALWAVATAEQLGLLPDPSVVHKATTWLTQEMGRVDGNDHESRATILHALSTVNKAPFEQVNALNRVRMSLSNVSLAYLALTFANADRASLGEEVIGILAPRGKTEPTVPGGKSRRFWSGEGQHPWHRSDAETTALAAFAYAKVRPGSPDLEGAVDWLTAHRQGLGWQPPKAKGPALAALASFYGKAQGAEDRYSLVVTVNNEQVYKAEIVGATEAAAVRVPRRFVKGAKNRVKFDIAGRGRYGYAVTLTGFTRDFGPDQDRANKPFVLHRRVYWPAR